MSKFYFRHTMYQYYFAGRPTQEKGWQHILDILSLIKHEGHTCHIHLCGPGQTHPDLQPFVGLPRVSIYGRLDNKEMSDVRKQCHWCLMPSLFLETFGRSALEACADGIPVLGPCEGGLTAFVHPDWYWKKVGGEETRRESWKTYFLRSLSCQNTQYHALRQWSYEQAKKFSYHHWIKEKNKLIHGSLMIITDYAVKIGGIENHVYEIVSHTKPTPIIVGASLSPNIWGRIKKYRGVITNFFLPLQLLGFPRKRSSLYDTLWVHGCSRFWGPWLVWLLPRVHYRLVSIHDYSFVAPFAHCVWSEEDIPATPQRTSWIETMRKKTASRRGWGKRIMFTFLTCYKRLVMWLMRQGINNWARMIIIPSSSMLPFVQRYTQLPITIFAPGFTTQNQAGHVETDHVSGEIDLKEKNDGYDGEYHEFV
ncbi:MAG: glycosyltransferase [Candidatus Absconditabacterales bacterium]|nr:glycosyltransferase [Candidatus Absconditabacterales bacterium]